MSGSLYFAALVKPASAAATIGLIAAHFVGPLDAATIAVGALWTMLVAIK